jgi:predicted esterase
MTPSRAPTDPPLLSWIPAEVVPEEARRPLLVLLHGAEDEPSDVLAWAGALDPGERWHAVAVTAPFGSAPEGRVWFRSSPRGPDPADVDEALSRLDATIGHLCCRSEVAGREIVVVGYSQGGAMALMLAADVATRSVRAAVSVCGWLPDVEGRSVGTVERSGSRPRVLVLNGSADAVVPVDFGDAAVLTLGAAGLVADAIVAEGGHHPTTETLATVGDWLNALGSEEHH